MKTLRMASFLAAVLVLTLVAACEQAPTLPPATGPAFQISDGAHSGNPHFYWKPPMVDTDPSPTGVFDGTLSPVVSICAWDGAACIAQVAEFTTETGPGSETVRVVLEDEHYIVNWHTNEFGLSPDVFYRIDVSVDAFGLGFADVDVVSNGAALKRVDTGEYIALLNGTLPIKFRIEEGAIPTEEPNEPPTATITSPSADVTAFLGDAVDFQGTAGDPDGTVVTHAWDFGDGSGAAVEDPGLHTYAATGVFTVTYHVTDDDGASSAQDMVLVTVEAPPFSPSSVVLDGTDDYLDMGAEPYNLGCCAGDAFSLSLWYKATATGEMHLMGAQNPGTIRRGYFLHLDASGNVCFSRVTNMNVINSGGFGRKCTATPPPLGEWHHVVGTSASLSSGTLARDELTLYVDGVAPPPTASGNLTSNNAFSNSGAHFTVGAAVCRPDEVAGCDDADGVHVPVAFPLQGLADEAAIYLVELTAAEVAAIYNAGSPTDLMALAPQPIGWWRMGECTDAAMTLVCDEGQGVVIRGVLRHFDGTLRNGAVFSPDVP